MNQHYELCVIGGGIVGLCSALQLQALGQSVAIFDQDRIGMGASFGNAGHLAVEQVFPIADKSVLTQLPSMLFDPLGPLRLDLAYLPKLMPWAVKLLLNMRQKPFLATHEALKALNGISLTAWQDFSKRWGLDEWVQVEGSLLTAETLQSVAKLQTHAKHLNDMGIATQFLSQQELQEMAPALSDSQLGAILFPKTGHITDLVQVIETLKEKFVQLGGVIYEHHKVLDVAVSDKVVLTTSQGEFFGNRVLVSMGAFSRPLVKKLTSIDVPLDTERGYHLMLPKEVGRLSIPVSSMDRRFIMTPMAGGLRLAGTVEYAGLTAPPNMDRAYNLLKLANPMLKTSLNDADKQAWMGFRPSTADSLPVIDKVGRVLLNFGHQHLGLTQAVASSELICALYFDKASAIDVSPYRLTRF